MSREEIWITDIEEITIEGECFRAQLASGAAKPIVMRGSRTTLIEGVGKAFAALDAARSADVVPLRRG